MAEKATDLIGALGEGGELVGLTVKVAPATKALVYNLRKRTSKGVSEIVSRALEAYFEGYEPTVEDEAEEADLED